MTHIIHITFPDGTSKSYSYGITPYDIAAQISTHLAKNALFAHVDEQPYDLHRPLEADCHLEILTDKDARCLPYLRHDAAHILAEAAKELYPDIQITIGPAIDNGFYYDFYREIPFTPDDLEKIEVRMREIIDRNEKIIREVWDRNDAIAFFNKQKEFFKAELISDLPEDETITFYRQGDFIDLCRGPHLPSTGKMSKAFKLIKISGSYWRGNAKNPSLQRIYGTAWANDKQLRTYLYKLQEAEKRDHRRLGKQMNLFHLDDVSPGGVFWHPEGWNLYLTIQRYMRQMQKKFGYIEVNTPQLIDKSLWDASGHTDKFQENMFSLFPEGDVLIKPMNCPAHVRIFKQGIKSYRDLPLRMAEFGACCRNEPSGALHGLMRVRAFTQDDAHIFVTSDQIFEETKAFCHMLTHVYRDFGFEKENIRVKFSDRPAVRAGIDAVWERAENILKKATLAAGLDFSLNPGEGAFYGPKLDFIIVDALEREWQCGTLQLDFVLPERLNTFYIAEDGQRQRPVMLHRAILGSFERFIGILIEHYGGCFPLWLAPTQVAIAPITNAFDTYATDISTQLLAQGIRVKSDVRNEKISYKIRELSQQKIPEIWIVGAKEQEGHKVTIRRLGSQKQETKDLDTALKDLIHTAQSPFSTNT